MSHPFRVGEKYHNRNGRYEVVEIDGTEMVIRYADGEVQRVNIALQQKIWENWQLDQEVEDNDRRAASVRKPTGASSPKVVDEQRVYKFAENDFKPSVAGTHWRARNNLGGQLARRLSSLTGRHFESISVPRKPQIQVVEPHAFNREMARQEAKFTLWLEEGRVCYGFYVEKYPDAMNQSWDWLTFVEAITQQAELRRIIFLAMQELTLRWEIYFDGSAQPAIIVIRGSNDTLLRITSENSEEEGQEVSWEEFVHEVRNIPESRQCELCLVHSMPKEQAVALGTQIIEYVVPVWKSLVPLYIASTRRP